MEIRRLIEGRASSDIISCALDIPVREAIALLASKRIGAIPVTEHGKVVGIFSERDVIYRLADEGDACLSRPLGDVMTAPAITVNRDTPVLEALALMTRRRIRHLGYIRLELGDQLPDATKSLPRLDAAQKLRPIPNCVLRFVP